MTAHIEVADLYRACTPNQLSEIAERIPPSATDTRTIGFEPASACRRRLFAVLQVLWLTVFLGLDVIGALALMQFYLQLLTWHLLLIIVVEIPFGILLWGLQIVVFKWCWIGRYKRGWYKLHGLFHFQHWVVSTYMSLSFLGLQYSFGSGTMLSVWFLRLLGAKIGRGVHIGHLHHISGFDLLHIEDGATLNIRASLLAVRYTHRGIDVGPIHVGPGATLGARTVVHAGCKLGSGSVVWDLSTLPRDTEIGQCEIWTGVLAKRCTHDDPLYKFITCTFPDPLLHAVASKHISCCREWQLTVIVFAIDFLIFIGTVVPVLLIFCDQHSFQDQLRGESSYLETFGRECRLDKKNNYSIFVWIPLVAFVAVFMSFLISSLLMRIIPRTRPGMYALSSAKYMCMYLRLLLFNKPWNAIYSSTTWANILYRLSGSKINMDTRVTKPGVQIHCADCYRSSNFLRCLLRFRLVHWASRNCRVPRSCVHW
eukprot:SAG31_NODE_557_length_14160_cov_18.420880_1_plen_482_part_00